MHGDTTDTDMYFFRLRILLINELKSIYNILHCFLKGQDVFGKKTDILDSCDISWGKKTRYLSPRKEDFIYLKKIISSSSVWLEALWVVPSCCVGASRPTQHHLLSHPLSGSLPLEAFVLAAAEGSHGPRSSISFVRRLWLGLWRGVNASAAPSPSSVLVSTDACKRRLRVSARSEGRKPLSPGGPST